MPRRKYKPIGTIAAELKACSAAFAKHPKATLAWCIHHRELVEEIEHNNIQKRIRYIMRGKPTLEKAWRLRNLRPVKLRNATVEDCRHDLLNKEWPDNTWISRRPGEESSIFPASLRRFS